MALSLAGQIDESESVIVAAVLNSADLTHASLNNADLISVDLGGANLNRADLTGANLGGANLSEANLGGANLSGAGLFGANLSDSDLGGANLAEAHLAGTVFANVDLTSAISLETCIHHAPSTIDHRTLQKSRSLPLSFLRGVGLPDSLIEYLPSLLNQAVQYFSCFISYRAKGEDEEFAKRLHADLQNKGLRCWFAPHDLPIGEGILEGIDAAAI
jgi:hypothetical protein